MLTYGLVQTGAPAIEPVPLSELKTHLRVDQSGDDTDILAYALAARMYCELYLDRQFITATYTYTIDSFYGYDMPGGQWLLGDRPIPQRKGGGGIWPQNAVLRMPRAPLQSVTSIYYIEPAAGASLLLDPSQYNVSTGRVRGRITPSYGNVWPVTREVMDAVTITFVAGYGGSAGSIPEPIRLAIKLLTGAWFNAREEISDLRLMRLPVGIANLLALYMGGGYL